MAPKNKKVRVDEVLRWRRNYWVHERSRNVRADPSKCMIMIMTKMMMMMMMMRNCKRDVVVI